MEELTAYGSLETKTARTEGGAITRLISKEGISEHGNIEWDNKTVLANYVYKKNETYDLVYSIVDVDGNVTQNYLENNGILPTLFKNPDNELYVSISPYHPELPAKLPADKELEITVPLLNRAAIQEPKHNRPFAGKFIGNVNKSSIFYDIDIFSDKTQDKLLNIEFKNSALKKKHTIKIDFPKDNKIFIGNNEIHLLALDKNVYVHRQIDEEPVIKIV